MIVAMGTEPAPELSANDVRHSFMNKHSEKDLADAFALASNQFFWVEDEEYDFEEGSPERQRACHITDEWGALMDEYKERIFAILSNEGVDIPKTAQIHVLIPFMERNGYIDATGWWIKETDYEG